MPVVGHPHETLVEFRTKWREIELDLLEDVPSAIVKLMTLAREGDGRAAERVLEQGDSKHVKEALQLLFEFPDRVKAPLDYWNLYAANIEFQKRDYAKAIQRLTPISESNSEYRDRALAFIGVIRGQEHHILKDAMELSDDSLPRGLLMEPTPKVVQDLLQQCIEVCHQKPIDAWHQAALQVLLANASDVAPSIVAEAYRLCGKPNMATPIFQQVIAKNGSSVQTIAGLADCTRDIEAMKMVSKSTSVHDDASYWFWLSNVRLIQWYVEDGGNRSEAIAKINRLRKKDASLGGAIFNTQLTRIYD